MGDLSDLMATILASNIKTLRLRERITQVEFSDLLGVTQGTVARWEQGSRPDIEHIVRMAALAGVPVPVFTNQLLTDNEPFEAVAGELLLLPVQLPSEDALTAMFEGLIETMPANTDSPEFARKLAQLLPGALARAVSHRQGGIEPPDRPQPRQGAGEGAPINRPARPR